MVDINLTEAEKENSMQYWDNIEPMLHEQHANSLVVEVLEMKSQIETLQNNIARIYKLLLFYRGEYTDVNESVNMQDKSLTLRKNKKENMDINLFKELVNVNSFLNEVTNAVSSINANRIDEKEIKKLLAFLPATEQKLKLDNWINSGILKQEIKYDLVIK